MPQRPRFSYWLTVVLAAMFGAAIATTVVVVSRGVRLDWKMWPFYVAVCVVVVLVGVWWRREWREGRKLPAEPEVDPPSDPD